MWNISWNTGRSASDPALARRKPAGGFCFIAGMALIASWQTYKASIITWHDLRVWFACFELVARRCGLRPDRCPRYGSKEILALVGGRSEGRVKRSLRRLENAGLLRRSHTTMELTVPTSFDPSAELAVSNRMLHRRVPVPRRMIRFMARSSRPVVAATIVGHLLRCLYYRNRLCWPEGSVKASWIAEVFEVDARNVKAARKSLVKLGWLRLQESSQPALNRLGAKTIINLEWNDVSATRPRHESPPRPADSDHRLPPPRKRSELSTRILYQKPGRPGPTGVQCGESVVAANLKNVVEADLMESARLAELFKQACQKGWVRNSEADRLSFITAAVRARRVGDRNPCGLFVSLVKRRLLNFSSNADEDVARMMLARERSTNPNEAQGALDAATTKRAVATATLESAGSVLSRLMAHQATWPQRQRAES